MKKEICKNCEHCKPTYKGFVCDMRGKKTKGQGTCERWWPK